MEALRVVVGTEVQTTGMSLPGVKGYRTAFLHPTHMCDPVSAAGQALTSCATANPPLSLCVSTDASCFSGELAHMTFKRPKIPTLRGWVM